MNIEQIIEEKQALEERKARAWRYRAKVRRIRKEAWRKRKSRIAYITLILLITLLIASVIYLVSERDKPIITVSEIPIISETFEPVRMQSAEPELQQIEVSKAAVKEEPELISLGEFSISHYCCEAYKHICGTGDGITATGTKVREGVVAVDPKVIPYGTIVVIDEVEYIAEDCGGAIKGNKIDIAVDTHERALQLGIKTAEVFIKEEAQNVQVKTD